VIIAITGETAPASSTTAVVSTAAAGATMESLELVSYSNRGLVASGCAQIVTSLAHLGTPARARIRRRPGTTQPD
jgi:hypothetical protein